MQKINFLRFLFSCCLMFSMTWTYAQTTVTCGTPTNDTHCYDNADLMTWTYTSSDGVSGLNLVFAAGGIESCCDNIIIYDLSLIHI